MSEYRQISYLLDIATVGDSLQEKLSDESKSTAPCAHPTSAYFLIILSAIVLLSNSLILGKPESSEYDRCIPFYEILFKERFFWTFNLLQLRGGVFMPLGGVIFLTIFVAIFGMVILFAASRFGKRKYDPVKFESYECGIPVQEKKDTKISVKFYLTAILFILFDIEIIFMYPWATTFRDFIKSGEGGYVFVSMIVFLLVFIFGLFWEVKSKALEWE